MNQMLFLMLGLAGLVGLGSLMSGNDDNHPPERNDFDLGDRELEEGTDGDDTMTGTSGDDALTALDGNDLIDGGTGDDMIWGGFGNDTVIANPGDDLVYLGGGADLYGAHNPGADEGSDTIVGGSGDDTIITNGGNHEIYGDGDPEDIDKGDDEYEGRDSIYDVGGTVYVDGRDGSDLIWSPDDSTADALDTLLGGDGDDTIYAGGLDLVDGGSGSDTVVLRSDAGGPADITFSSSDRIEVALPEGYEGEPDLQLTQDGDDVRVVVDGNEIAVLRDIRAGDVRAIRFLTQDELHQPPWLAG